MKRIDRLSGAGKPEEKAKTDEESVVFDEAAKEAVKKVVLAQNRKQKALKFGVVVMVLLAFAVVLGGVVLRAYWKSAEYHNFQSEQEEIFNQTKTDFAKLYQDKEAEIPTEDVEQEAIDKLVRELGCIKYKEYLNDKEDMLAKLEVLRSFLPVRDAVLEVFDDEVMKSDTTSEKIAELKEKVSKLVDGQKMALAKRIEMLETQRAAIDELQAAVTSLYTDAGRKTLRTNITQAQYDVVAAMWGALPQEDVKDAEQSYLEKAKVELDRRAAEEARKAAEERRKREAAIAAAWKTLNVPYISQNGQAIFNGCEAAALLMGLQYKGYLGGMTLRQYVEMMPKSEDDPNQGFVGSVYDLEPKTLVHWIAPAPLAKFGRETSGANVQDVTGSSLDQLKNEILSGNPVVIYLTFQYNPPKEWLNGAPKNLHVMLLTGYNSLTDEFQTTDPWTGAGGKSKYTLPRVQVESLFNRTGKRAVVVRG